MPRLTFLSSCLPVGVDLVSLFIVKIVRRVSCAYAAPSFTSPGDCAAKQGLTRQHRVSMAAQQQQCIVKRQQRVSMAAHRRARRSAAHACGVARLVLGSAAAASAPASASSASAGSACLARVLLALGSAARRSGSGCAARRLGFATERRTARAARRGARQQAARARQPARHRPGKRSGARDSRVRRCQQPHERAAPPEAPP